MGLLAHAMAQMSAGQSLEFQPSSSQMHVTVQPRRDYHRVHIVIRARGLANERCIASLKCSSNETELEDSRVNFTPRTDSQSFDIYLRTPRLPDRNATYVLQVAPSDGHGPDLSRKGSLIYAWEVKRDANKTASVEWPKPGETFTIVIAVSHQVPVDGGVEFKIVWETKTREVTVPPGFVFGVDAFDATDVFEPVRARD